MKKERELTAGLVSLIVPSFNVESYIEQFLDSILLQTYDSIELILVNDGSTDSTREIIEAYERKLRARLNRVRIVDQVNRGLAGAVDTGLKHFTGEFLLWPDPDDWLTENSISRRVSLMQSNPDVGLLRTSAQKYMDCSGDFAGYVFPPDGRMRREDGLFETMLTRGTYFAPVCTFVRSSAFLQVNPDRRIHVVPNASQNLQMLLPLVREFASLEVGESLAFYRVREDSRSRMSKTPQQMLARQRMLHTVTIATLKQMPHLESGLLDSVNEYYRRKFFLPLSLMAGSYQDCKLYLLESSLSPLRKFFVRTLIQLDCICDSIGLNRSGLRRLLTKAFNRFALSNIRRLPRK